MALTKVLCTYAVCVAQCSWVISNMGVESVSDIFCLPLEPFSCYLVYFAQA